MRNALPLFLYISINESQSINYKKQDLKMMVYDFAGALVEAKDLTLRHGSNVFSSNTDSWKPGAYLVQLITETGTIHKKLIIQTHLPAQ